MTSPASTAIAKVKFFRGSAELGEDTEAPYSLEVPITSADNGSLEFSEANAFDLRPSTFDL